MRIKASLLLSLMVLAAVGVDSSDISDSQSRAVTTTQLAAWITGGVSGGRLARLVKERGLATLPTHKELKQLELVGADGELMKAVGAGHAFSRKIGPAIPDGLVKAASDAAEQRFHRAETELRGVIATDEDNPALRFALGVVLRQQDKLDDAYDELAAALQLMPDLPENHNAMAYLFYRLDDGPNAIAKARTALSIDPKNAEAYQDLGLGESRSGSIRLR